MGRISMTWKRPAGLVALAFALGFAASGGAFAQDKSPITIGCGMALTGGLAGGGKGALLAMQIWTDEINAKGGLLGRQVKLDCYDDHSKPDDVPPLYEKLISVDKVDF